MSSVRQARAIALRTAKPAPMIASASKDASRNGEADALHEQLDQHEAVEKDEQQVERDDGGEDALDA